MQYVHLDRSGVKVSRLCLGTMNFVPETNEADSFAIMDRALELGLNFFDTANVYGWKVGERWTEQIVGRWFAQGGGGVRKSFWRRKCSAGWASGRINPARRPSTSSAPARTACDACRRMASICIKCIMSIGRRRGRRSGRRWSVGPGRQGPLCRQQQFRRLACGSSAGTGAQPPFPRPRVGAESL